MDSYIFFFVPLTLSEFDSMPSMLLPPSVTLPLSPNLGEKTGGKGHGSESWQDLTLVVSLRKIWLCCK